MKLSEAIRLGAMLKPQAFFTQCARGLNGEALSTCALASALDAHSGVDGNLSMESMVVRVADAFPFADAYVADCPVCRFSDAVAGVVVCLNDVHGWTREEIADWVATIEAQHEQQEQPQPVSVEVAQ